MAGLIDWSLLPVQLAAEKHHVRNHGNMVKHTPHCRLREDGSCLSGFTDRSFQGIPILIDSSRLCDSFHPFPSLLPCLVGCWTQAWKVLRTGFEVPACIVQVPKSHIFYMLSFSVACAALSRTSCQPVCGRCPHQRQGTTCTFGRWSTISFAARWNRFGYGVLRRAISMCTFAWHCRRPIAFAAACANWTSLSPLSFHEPSACCPIGAPFPISALNSPLSRTMSCFGTCWYTCCRQVFLHLPTAGVETACSYLPTVFLVLIFCLVRWCVHLDEGQIPRTPW